VVYARRHYTHTANKVLDFLHDTSGVHISLFLVTPQPQLELQEVIRQNGGPIEHVYNEVILPKDLRNKIHCLLSNSPINRVLVKYFCMSTIHAPPCTYPAYMKNKTVYTYLHIIC
jgi:hypothetical protein